MNKKINQMSFLNKIFNKKEVSSQNKISEEYERLDSIVREYGKVLENLENRKQYPCPISLLPYSKDEIKYAIKMIYLMTYQKYQWGEYTKDEYDKLRNAFETCYISLSYFVDDNTIVEIDQRDIEDLQKLQEDIELREKIFQRLNSTTEIMNDSDVLKKEFQEFLENQFVKFKNSIAE